MASSRAIGIGAYLVRLGQRVVQVTKAVPFHNETKMYLEHEMVEADCSKCGLIFRFLKFEQHLAFRSGPSN